MKQSLVDSGADPNCGFIPVSLVFMVHANRYNFIISYTIKFMEFMIKHGADVNSEARDRLDQRATRKFSRNYILCESCRILSRRVRRQFFLREELIKVRKRCLSIFLVGIACTA